MARGESVPMCRECGHALAWGCYKCEEQALARLNAQLTEARRVLREAHEALASHTSDADFRHNVGFAPVVRAIRLIIDDAAVLAQEDQR